MRTLIVVAHLDDETLGLGGTITKMCREGNPNDLKVLALCKGRAGINVEEREESFYKVATELGFIGVWCDYQDLTLESVPLNEIADIISDHIRRHKPERVICNSIDDIHQDHVVVSRATRIACRPFNQETVKELYEFKIPGSSTGQFNIASDVTGYITDKVRLMEYYKSEVKAGCQHPFSVDGQCTVNAADGVEYNMAYAELLRMVWSCNEF